MAISLDSVHRGADAKPPILVLSGVGGIGKTTLAASAPNPIFIRTEDGMGVLESDRFPVAQTFADVMEALSVLAQGGHDYKTVVLDSADWTESLIHKLVAASQSVTSIEDIGYGKGFTIALEYWREYLNALTYLRDTLGMAVIQICHVQIMRHEPPDGSHYDRYAIKLHKKASALIVENADAVLFANYRVTTNTEDLGFNAKRKVAVGSGDWMLWTSERPAHVAKNRYAMPDEIPMELVREGMPPDQVHAENWSRIARFIPYFNQTQEQPNG